MARFSPVVRLQRALVSSVLTGDSLLRAFSSVVTMICFFNCDGTRNFVREDDGSFFSPTGDDYLGLFGY